MNKIFFETIAATLLSVMAIIVSVQQTKLSRTQTKISLLQLDREERLARFQKTAHWGELRDAMWKILDCYPPPGIHALKSMPKDSQISFFKRIREILDSQTANPVLIENRKCLGHWRNAISGAKVATDMLSSELADSPEIQNQVEVNASSILSDVLYVWTELVLHSDEVSATGGRPKEDQNE